MSNAPVPTEAPSQLTLDVPPRRRWDAAAMAGWAVIGLAAAALVVVLALRDPLSAAPAADAVAWRSDVSAAIDEARAAEKPLLLYFTADWCGPCQAMQADVFPKPAVKEALESRFVPVKLDMSDPFSRYAALEHRMSVRGYPTFVVVTADGQELARLNRAADAPTYLAWLSRAAGGGPGTGAAGAPRPRNLTNAL